RLRKAGFMRVLCQPGDRRGNTYSPDFAHVQAEVQKFRSPERFAPGSPGANGSAPQSYSSSSNFQRADGDKLASAAGPSGKTHPPQQPKAQFQTTERATKEPKPWKRVTVASDEVQAMHDHLERIVEKYPRTNFGQLSGTTARDILAAAKLANPT